ncbi:VOC family protein [Pedobacter gandavensis]|uniref:Glyoxalase n=1 Tax=Pedobacter gandavensis TaxID=2679963 RepID=A0ABR6ETX4_9SPHI|nr:glyoxalase [Pedobacter gandavensis]MBB2148718.1 glyoxalase [Pedobacter gandavensis]
MEIKELQIITNQLEETERFYNQILNMATLDRTENEVSFQVGRTKLSFVGATADQPVYHIAFDIPKNKLVEAYEWLKLRTVILPVTPESNFSNFELWNAKSFYFHDNNKNLLELICRCDLENESEQPFDGSSILAISEIGLVADDVPFLAETLMSKYGLEIYEKQPAHDNFTVLGDENGLFILVNQDRDWYPTAQKAKSFPVKLIFNNGSGEDQELSIS